MNKYLSASLMCSKLSNLSKDILFLNDKIDFFHIDMMDNHFVSNLGFSYDDILQIKEIAKLPLDFHLMVDNPVETIKKLPLGEKDMVSIHVETIFDFNPFLSLVKERNINLLLVVTPNTPLKLLEIFLPYIKGINFLTVVPGYYSQKINLKAFERGKLIGEFLRKTGKDNFIYEVDGNMTLENISRFSSFGANCFVLGTSSIFPHNFLSTTLLNKVLDITTKI